MTEAKNEFGVVGLGRMGGDLALQALEKGMRVVGSTRKGAPDEMLGAGLVEVGSLEEFKARLAPPRVVFLYIPAGPPVDQVLDDLAEQLDEGDILVDGGNSYWGDSIRRHQRLEQRGLRFVDVGTSGGLSGARSGACFMAGGQSEAVAIVEPLLRSGGRGWVGTCRRSGCRALRQTRPQWNRVWHAPGHWRGSRLAGALS